MKLFTKALAGTMIFAATASQATELVGVDKNDGITVNEIRIELTQSLQPLNIKPLKIKESAKAMLVTHSNDQFPMIEEDEDILLIATAD